MLRRLLLSLLALLLMAQPTWAGFFGGPGIGGMVNTSGVPQLVRNYTDYGTPLGIYKPDGTLGSQSGSDFDVTSGYVVGAKDSSGNGRHLSNGTAADSPIYVANCINGYACMDIGSNPSNKRQIARLNDDMMQNRAGASVYYIFKANDTGKYLNGLQWTENGSFANMRVQIQIADGTSRMLMKGERLDSDTLTQTFSSNNAYTSGSWTRAQGLIDFTNGNHKLFTATGLASTYASVVSANFTSGGGGNSENTASGWFLVGHNANNATSNPYYMGEIAVMNGVSTWGERMGIDNILTHKYRPDLEPTLASATGIIGQWEHRPAGKYITRDFVGTTTTSSIKDQSANGYTFSQATKGLQPSTNTNGFSANFTAASSQQMSLASGGLGLIKNTAQICSVTVFRPTTTHLGYLLWFSEGTAPTSYRYATRITAGGKFEVYQRKTDGDNGYSLASSNSYDTGKWNMARACVDYTGNAVSIVLNGTTTSGSAGSTGTTSNTNSLNATLGSSNGSNYFNGDIAAVILSNALTDGSILDNYAMWNFI